MGTRASRPYMLNEHPIPVLVPLLQDTRVLPLQLSHDFMDLALFTGALSLLCHF